MFLALASSDPMDAYDWLKKNRLTFLSIPGFRCGVYEDVGTLLEKAKDFEYSQGEIHMLGLLHAKLKPLEGK